MIVIMKIALRSAIVVTGLSLAMIGIGILVREIKRWRNIIHLRRVIRRIENEGFQDIKAEVKE